MMMKLKSVMLTHDQLMKLLPTGTTYALTSLGYPCSSSITLAMLIQSLAYIDAPYDTPREYRN